MGGKGSKSSSTIRNENNTLIVNQSKINQLNEQINSTSTNSAINQSSTCSNSVNVSNMIDFSNSVIEGDFIWGDSGNDPNKECQVELSQSVASNFKCLQSTDVRNEMGISMIDTIMQNMKSSIDKDVANKMEATAAAKSEAGALSFGTSNSKSNITNINNYKSMTNDIKNIENVVKNSVEANLTVDDAKHCINKVDQSQGLDASGAFIKGKVNICNFKSDQVANIFGECIQETKVANKITEDIAKNLDLTVEKTDTTKVASESTSTAESTSKTAGLEGMCGALLAMCGLAALLPIIMMFGMPCCIMCCIACCCIFMMMGGKGGSAPAANNSPMGPPPDMMGGPPPDMMGGPPQDMSGPYPDQYGGYFKLPTNTNSLYTPMTTMY